MIQSMTGFGNSSYSDQRYAFSVEIKGYNNRYLDIQLNLPSSLGALEPELRDLIKKSVNRGRVEVFFRLQSLNEEPVVEIDEARARAISAGLTRLFRSAGIRERVKGQHLLSFDGLIRLEKNRDPEQVSPLVTEQVKLALEGFVNSRMAEGKRTVSDIEAQLLRFESAFSDIAGREAEIETHLSSLIRSRFDEVLGDRVEEDRILTELASLLLKHSINEEISRIRTHIDHFRQELSAGGALGKRLDFLCQEMNRETNTIGSKNIMTDFAALVVEMKDSLENIREQLRNIE